MKDLVRVEGWVADGLLERGFVVALTNNRRLYRPGRAGCIDADFRIHEGAVLEGVRRWASHAGAGTIEKRQDDLVVRGRHVCRWRPYATVESADFRVLILPVPGVEPR